MLCICKLLGKLFFLLLLFLFIFSFFFKFLMSHCNLFWKSFIIESIMRWFNFICFKFILCLIIIKSEFIFIFQFFQFVFLEFLLVWVLNLLNQLFLLFWFKISKSEIVKRIQNDFNSFYWRWINWTIIFVDL